MMVTLRAFTRELAGLIDTYVSSFPVNFYQKKLDGKKAPIHIPFVQY
jgi:regulatory factor X 1/2/3/regulatory factor X 4